MERMLNLFGPRGMLGKPVTYSTLWRLRCRKCVMGIFDGLRLTCRLGAVCPKFKVTNFTEPIYEGNQEHRELRYPIFSRYLLPHRCLGSCKAIINILEIGNAIDVSDFDLAKASDTVDHCTLLYKCNTNRFKGSFFCNIYALFITIVCYY